MRKALIKYKNYILSFIIPMLICIFILYIRDVINNPEIFLVSDLRMQIIAFFEYIKNIVNGDSSIYYSFYAGMGSSMLSTVIYYCISPINILLFIVNDIIKATICIYILKIALAGLTSYIYLKSKLKDYADKEKYMTLVFSICYALSSFTINYYFLFFWFDSIYLAPLVLLGIDKIIENKKFNFIYPFSLALAIICNIQMGFILCVFSVVYFIYSVLLKFKLRELLNNKRIFLIFIILSLLAGGISSGIILGFLTDYDKISVTRYLMIADEKTAYLFNIFKNIFSVGHRTKEYFNEQEPYVYCGLIVTYLSFLYFSCKDISKKEKCLSLGVIIFFVFSFCIKFMNNFWHVTYPVLLNFRYSYLLSLFLILLAQKTYYLLKKIDIKFLLFMIIYIIIIVVCYRNNVYLSYTIIFNVLIIISLLLIFNYKKRLEPILIIIVIVEVVINYNSSLYLTTDIIFDKYSDYDDALKICKQNELDQGYRSIYNYSYTGYTNDNLICNNNSSLRYFSSTMDGKILSYFEKVGSLNGNNNYRMSAYDSPLILSLFGAKYYYLEDNYPNSLFELKETKKYDAYDLEKNKKYKQDVYFYENPYALSLGYMIDEDVQYTRNLTYIDFQNKLIKGFTSTKEDVLIDLEYHIDPTNNECKTSKYLLQEECNSFTIENKNHNVYVNNLFESFNIAKNSIVNFDVEKNLFIYSLEDNIKISIANNQGLKEEDLVAFTYDKEVLIRDLKKLQENMLEDVVINNNKLTANIDANKDGLLFLSIPYDSKWKIYVDGKEVKYKAILNKTFIGVDLKKGNHKIYMEYSTDLKLYIMLSLGTFVGSVVIVILGNIILDKKFKNYELNKI